MRSGQFRVALNYCKLLSKVNFEVRTDDDCNKNDDVDVNVARCLQLWKIWKTREFFNSGKLGEFLIYSGNFCKCDRGHRVLCIIVSNGSLDRLGGTVTAVGGASHHAPLILK